MLCGAKNSANTYPMIGKFLKLKYIDPGSPKVDVHIGVSMIQKISSGFGCRNECYVTKDTMLRLNIQNLQRHTTIALQLADIFITFFEKKRSQMKTSAGAFETSWHIEKLNGEVWQYVKNKMGGGQGIDIGK